MPKSNDKPFTVCPSCKSPILDNEALGLVLMFRNEEDRQEFVDVFREAFPHLTAYPID